MFIQERWNSLKGWTNSSGIFMRLAPGLQIVPVLVSGVIWEKTAHHWLTRFKRNREEQEKLAAALQLLAMVARDARPTTVKIRFAKPINQNEIELLDPHCLHEKLMERMRCLIAQESREEGVFIS